MKNYWITFGVSYAGALSAWYRQKYPHLTHGALSSSGVVESILDFYQFDEHIARSVKSTCADAIRNVTGTIELALNSPQKQYVKSLFGATELYDLDFLYLIADSSALAVQYGHQGFLCDSLIQRQGDVIKNYANYCNSFFYPTFNAKPSDYDLATIIEENVDPHSFIRQWWYQECSELAYFNTAPANNPLRSSNLNLTYFKSRCEKAFGPNVWPNVDETNWNYGGKQFAGTNVYFTNGSQDPWSEASITRPHRGVPNAIVIQCQNCAHGVDVRGCPQIPTPPLGDASKCSPSQSVLQVRTFIAKEIAFWLDS